MPRPETFALTILCKATFTLRPGQSPLATEQHPTIDTDIYWETSGQTSLRWPSDLIPFKRLVDVFVTGHVYAPNGRPADALVARLHVGPLKKSICVLGDRVWLADGNLSTPLPFLKIPLRWERAAGGPGTSNPVGIPREGRVDARGKKTAPNFLPIAAETTPMHAPIGFAPIAPEAPERRDKLRGHAAIWNHDAWPNLPLPPDLDAGYFNVAPMDQQIDALSFPLRLELEALHSKHARLSTELEEVLPYARVRRQDGSEQEVRLRCDTVSIDSDKGTCSLVWRGLVPLRDPRETGEIEFTAERPNADPSTVMVEVRPDHGRALPFVAGVSGFPGDVVVREKGLDLSGATLEPWAGSAHAAVLPFGTGGSQNPEMTAEPWRDAVKPVLPFVAGNSAMANVASPVAPHVDTGTRAPWEQRVPDPLPVVPEEPRFFVEKPAMLGSVGPVEEPKVIKEAKVEVPKPIEEKDWWEEYPLERCAAIAARMACHPRESRAILEREGLSVEKWHDMHEVWLEEIREESGHGEKKMLAMYDEAYVAALEAERGVIGPKEYARMVLASERGKEAAVLREMRVPAEAMMRIRRVWLGKMVRERHIGKEVRQWMRAE